MRPTTAEKLLRTHEAKGGVQGRKTGTKKGFKSHMEAYQRKSQSTYQTMQSTYSTGSARIQAFDAIIETQ